VSKDELSDRQKAKQQRRKAGDRSSELARIFMLMKDATLAKLELQEEVRDAIDRARAVKSPIARRRAERTLAGDLRGHDLVDLATQVENVEQTGVADSQLFHLAEQWRTRLIEEAGALAEFPGKIELRFVMDARRERDTGKPPGAKRTLFRQVLEQLRQRR
jgi:ribosome-associated protein